MSHSRLNHNTAAYGDYLIISGGHTLKNMVPQEVPPSVCFKVESKDPVEYSTPYMGSTKLGMGLAMVGDDALLDALFSKKSTAEYFSSVANDSY